MQEKFIKRHLYYDLKKHLYKKEITLIVGPRQSGKTTLMNSLKKHLEKKGEKTLFMSLDFEHDKKYFQSQENLINKIKLEFGDSKAFVFIDEIQRKENAGIFLKGIYDLDLPYKFIVSGSGNLELKEKIHESLAGRKIQFSLNTVSFLEFIDYKTKYKYENKLNDYFKIEKEKVNSLLDEYMNFGGYPKVITEETREEKTRAIDELITSYLERDISFWLEVEKIDEFDKLIKLLSTQIGQIINYSEISNTIGISSQTVKKYLYYLEKTFIIKRVNPYFTNKRKELSKAPVYYFIDLGFRNFVINRFGNLLNSTEKGLVFENFIFLILESKIKFTNQKINYWRTKDGSEVDFIINSGEQFTPYEVKYKDIRKINAGRSLINFIKLYSPQNSNIICKNDSENKKKLDNINVLPFWELYNK